MRAALVLPLSKSEEPYINNRKSEAKKPAHSLRLSREKQTSVDPKLSKQYS